MRQSIVRLLVLVAVSSLSLLVALPALAQYPPTETDTTPDASFACDGLTEGGTATCSLGGWQAGSEVTVTVTRDQTAVFADTVTADDSGFVNYSFAVPADADDLAFTHAGILLDGTPATHTEVLAVAAPAGGTTDPAPDDLATTGEMISLLMLAAVLALAVGVVAVRRGRAREAATTRA